MFFHISTRSDPTSNLKMISLQEAFVINAVIFIGFTRTEKKYVKVIDDDIYSKIAEFKMKHKIMKMNRNYDNVDKKIRGVLKCKGTKAK